MSFTDHKITAFTHKVSDLPDEPQIPAADLKSRFDACPEELRVAHNAVCDDAARLEARVEGIVVDTFGDTIDKEMLSDELAAELDAKATQSVLSAEAAARESADDALDTRLTAAETALPEKAECYFGSYTGLGDQPVTVTLGFQPKAVIVCNENGEFHTGARSYGGMCLPEQVYNYFWTITETGFTVKAGGYANVNGDPYYFIAFR